VRNTRPFKIVPNDPKDADCVGIASDLLNYVWEKHEAEIVKIYMRHWIAKTDPIADIQALLTSSEGSPVDADVTDRPQARNEGRERNP